MRISRRELLAGGLGIAGAGVLGACGNPGTGASPSAPVHPGSDLGAVEHVVFLMQENRSFDHYYGAYPGVRGFDDRSNGALARFTQQWPDGPAGQSTLQPFNLASATSQICSGNAETPNHDWAPQHESWDGGTNAAFVSTHSEARYDGAAQGP